MCKGLEMTRFINVHKVSYMFTKAVFIWYIIKPI